MARGKDERHNPNRLVFKNFQCEHCLEPFYRAAYVLTQRGEVSGEALCPHCNETNVSSFNDAQFETKLPRDAYDTSETDAERRR